MGKKYTYVVIFLLIFSSIVFVGTEITIGYEINGPIRIDSNSEFHSIAASEGWVGSGTSGDPYIIDNYEIDGNGTEDCVYIGNTTVHFILENNHFYNSSNVAPHSSPSGLFFNNVTNGVIRNNKLIDNNRGITLNNSHDLIIDKNDIENNTETGIYMSYSENNTIDENHLYSNNKGMLLFTDNNYNNITNNRIEENNEGILAGPTIKKGSEYNLIKNNKILNNSNEGLNMNHYCDNNEITLNHIYNNSIGIYQHWVSNYIHNNTIDNSSEDGIQLRNSNKNIIEYNDITNSNDKGLMLWGSDKNNIYRNNFSFNMDGIYSSFDGGNLALNNTIISNEFFENEDGVVLWYESLNNTIVKNSFINNTDYSIWIRESSNNNLVENNNIMKGSYGIYLQESHNCDIILNNIYGCTRQGIQLFNSNTSYIYKNEIKNIDGSNDRGIYIRELSTHNLVIENDVHNNNQGIFLSDGGGFYGYPQYNMISDNMIYDNLDAGVFIDDCNFNTVDKNEIYNNYHGIYLSRSNITKISNNHIYGGHMKGIQFFESHKNKQVNSNYVYDNIRGIYLENSNNNSFFGNTIKNNSDGIRLRDSSDHNIIKLNDFIDNGYGSYAYKSNDSLIYLNNYINNSDENAMENTAHNYYNGSSLGNYWDDYTGSDSDGDGIGDTTHDIPGGMSTDYYPLWDIYDDNIYWVEEGGTGDGKIEGNPAGNISFVVDNYDLTDSIVNVKTGSYDELNENYPLTIDDNNVTFKAINGTDETFIISGGSGIGFDIDSSFVSIHGFSMTNFSNAFHINGENITIKNNNIYNNNANGLYSLSSSNITTKDNHFYDNSAEDIYLFQVDDSVVQGNKIDQSGDESIYLHQSNNITVVSNSMTNSSMGGIYVRESFENEILENIISNSSYGITLYQESHYNYVQNNRMNDIDNRGIDVMSSENNTIENNEIKVSYSGVFVIDSDNNTVTDNTVEDSGYQGIRIDTSDNNVVHNNMVKNSTTENGIWVKSDKSIISHNFVYNCSYGITFYSTTNSTVHNNTVRSSQMKGIRLDKSDNNEVNDNTVTSNEDGIYISDSQFNIISGNTAEENFNHGIYLNGVSDNEVIDNTANSNKINGIYLDNANNNTISANTVDTNEESGIYIEGSNDVSILGNNLSSNNYSAIVLEMCKENSLSNNVMTDNGIRIIGYQLIYWNTHSIGSSNEVNGKSVEYIKDQNSGSVSNDAGQVIIVNSRYIDVESQDLFSASIGLQIAYSDNNTLSSSTISENSLYGIYLYESQDNLLTDNNITSNNIGIYLHISNENIVRNSTISNSQDKGIDYSNSNDNKIYHNNFENNSRHVRDYYNNIYDDGYPSGGNYWDTYDGEDRYSGTDQNLPGRDGIGDSSYSIGTNNDNYPLMVSWPMDNIPPVISSVSVTDVSTTSVTITWQTDEASDSMVNYSENPDLSDHLSVYQYEFVTSHSVEIEGLDLNTTYYFEVLSNDTLGNKVKADNEGNYYSFTTSSIPLLEITDLTSGEPTTGDNFTLEMDVNEDSRVSEVFFKWGFDGSISNNESISHSIDTWSKTIDVPSDASNISYSFHVRYDSAEWISTNVVEISVTDNDAPIISMQIPNAIKVNETANMSGSGSYDNIGIKNYTWEIEELSELLYGPTQSYRFHNTGNYTVRLTISDKTGNEASLTRNIKVLSYTPSVVEGIVVDSESNPIEGAAVYFDSGENITTGPDGNFSTEVTHGDRTLTVVKSGYLNYSREIYVERESTLDVGTIMLEKYVKIVNYKPVGEKVQVESIIEIQYSDDIMSAEVDVKNLPGDTEIYGNNVTFTPSSQMEYDTAYIVYVNATDMNGNKLDIFTWSFTTKSDDVLPSVIDYKPVGNQIPIDSLIEIQYSDYIMYAEVIVTDLSGEVKYADTNVTYTPQSDMEYDTTYNVYVNATDMDGNNLEMFTWSFTTESDDQEEYGYVEGRITDKDNNPLSGATVSFDSGEEFTTDENGFFSGQVKSGSREITVISDNYETFTDTLDIEKDQAINLDEIVMQEKDTGDGNGDDQESDSEGIGKTLQDNIAYIIIALIIAIALVILIIKKRGEPVEESEDLIKEDEQEFIEDEEAEFDIEEEDENYFGEEENEVDFTSDEKVDFKSEEESSEGFQDD